MFGHRTERFADPECDAALVRGVEKGSADAAAALYDRHGGLIYRFCLRLSKDPSIAEEVTQETFLVLIEQAGRFDPKRAAVSTWLCGIARNMIWKQIKRRERWQPMDARDAEGEAVSVEDHPDATLDRNEAADLVRQGIDDLPPHFREIIVLCEFEELTYQDAAQVLGVPVGTVRSRLHRAKTQLAQLLRCAPAISRRVGEDDN